MKCYFVTTGRLTNKIYADESSVSYTYMRDGKLATRTWARGITTAYTYALTGELMSVDYSDDTPDIAYAYDRIGRRISVTDASGIRTFTCTPDGGILTDTVHIGNRPYTLHESRDAFERSAGYALSNTVGGASALLTGMAQIYDDANRISEVSMADIPASFRYGYQPGSGLAETLAMSNGVTRETEYEPYRDLPSTVTHTNVLGIVLTRRTFVRDAADRLTGRTQYRLGDAASRFDVFVHNSRSEFISATIGTNDYAYLFDPIGNRERLAENAATNLYAADSLNRYTSISDSASSTLPYEFIPEFDADGNQTLLRTTTGIWHAAYNAKNRPVRFTGNDGATVIDMAYDYQGRRFEYKETVSGTVTRHERYLYRGYLQIAVLHTLVWDPTEPTATRPLLLSTPSGWLTYGFDQVKNATELFDSSGGIAAIYDYSPFGEITAITGAAALNPVRFSSEIFDLAIGLVDYNCRSYNPCDGRFISRDPIGERGGLNLYGFVGNDPINKWDMIGLLGVTVKGPDPNTLKPKLMPADYFMGPEFKNPDNSLPGPLDNRGVTRYNGIGQAAAFNCQCTKNSGNEKANMPTTYCLSCEIVWTAEIFLNNEFRNDRKILMGSYGHEQRHVLAVATQIDTTIVQPLSESESVFGKKSECTKAAGLHKQKYSPILQKIVDDKGLDRHGQDGHPNAHELYDPLPDSPWEGPK